MSDKWWEELSGHLGGVYPYYNAENTSFFSLTISDILNERATNKWSTELDPTGLVTKMCLPHLLGNRTLIKDVRRAPWMSSYQNGCWQPALLPLHGRLYPDPEEFTQQLRHALLEETAVYIENKNTIGILLSGGMDSRIAAGVLRDLQLRKEGGMTVVALTWGDENSRDVIYAQRIAKQFNWEMIHFPITAETLSNNIAYSGLSGAEVSPLHLHAMPDVAELQGIDAIIAGSYGDSVGRGEFSGRHVTQLLPILPRVLDRFGIVKREALDQIRFELEQDAIDSPYLKEPIACLRQREIEQEMHYMRRMLQSCMQIIATKIPLYQLFTAPAVFGLVWELDPSIRRNEWYARLLSKLPGDLLDIPWARTGQRYDNPMDVFDDYSKRYHRYGNWLRNDLRASILERLNSETIRGLTVFNDKGLDKLIKVWQKANTDDTSWVDEVISWVASLHDFIRAYDIPKPQENYNLKFRDSIYASVGGLYAESFIAARNRLRK